MEENPTSLYEKWFDNLSDWQKDLFNTLIERNLTADERISCFERYIDGGPLVVDRPQISFGFQPSPLKRLLGIYNINNVGKINNPDGITFNEDSNICLLFGNNGCGKSTLINLLKNVCGSRDAKDVRSNVFEEPKPSSTSVSYRTNEEITFEWSQGKSCPDLAGLQFFDSTYYRLYEKAGAEILLEPKLLAVLGEMVDSLNLFKSHIDGEKRKIEETLILPERYKETDTYKSFIQATSIDFLDKIEEQSKLSSEEESELEAISKLLFSSDPSVDEKESELAIKCLKDFSGNMRDWFIQYSDEKRKDLIELKEKCISLELTVKQAEDEFKGNKLKGTGNDSWKTLWKVARDYSEKYAYPGVPFPNSGNDSLCVLCQQPLSDDAKKRFISFEDYVTSDIEKSLKAADTELLNSTPQPIWAWEMISSYLLKNKVPENIIVNIQTFYIWLLKRSDEIRNKRNCETGTRIFSLEQFNAFYEKSISALESKRDISHSVSVQRQTNVEREIMLSSRKWFSQNKQVFDCKKKILRLSEFNTKTNKTSMLKTKMSSVLITDRFIKQFKEELEHIGAHKLRVELKISTDSGSSAHSIVLKDATKSLPFSEILSEGERRAVSFAAFVAEMIVNFPEMPLVFDDPTNSMDSKYEAAIAKRIIKLSENRQIIVFTHRITMSSWIYSKKGEKIINCQRLMSEPVGSINTDLSFILGNARANANTLLEEAKRISKQSGNTTPAKSELATKIRKLLELVIEDVLLDGIVKRHEFGIKSQKLPRMMGVKGEDFEFVHNMMSKYSSELHSQSAEASYPEVGIQEMIDDLEKIIKQISDIGKNKDKHKNSF